jgi:hypothetical protein
VSWQEELRKLDEELAAGQISADDYRVRRDQVLSSAVSAGSEAPPQGQQKPSEATQFVPRPPVSQPMPPPPPLPQAPGSPGDADDTQIVPGRDADRTQAVGRWQTARPGGDDADRTQVVPGVPPQSVAGGMPPRPAPPLGQFPPPPGYGWQQQDEISPPWAGSDFPPLAPAASPDWIRQGPEVFDTDRRSKTGRIVAIVAVVLLLAGLGVGGYFLLRPKGNSNQGQPGPATTSTSQPTSRTSSRPPSTSTTPPKPIAQPPGSTLVDAKFTLQRLGEVKILSPEDFDVMSRNKIIEAQVAVTKEGDLTRGTWAFKAADHASAEQIFKEIDQLYRQVNFQPAPGISKDHVSALYFKPPNAGPNAPTVFRAHYVAGSTVVRVEAYGPDAALAASEFSTLLDAQLTALPAEG